MSDSDFKHTEIAGWKVTTFIRETLSLSAGEVKVWAAKGGEVVSKDGRKIGETPYVSHDLVSAWWTRGEWAIDKAEVEVRVSNGEMAGVGLSVTIPRLIHASVKVGAPRRLIAPWVLEAREWAVTLGSHEVAELRLAWERDGGGQRRYLLDMEGRGEGRSYAGRWALWQGLRLGVNQHRLKTAILGKATCDVDVIDFGETTVPMPEGVYPATWEMERRTWRRARIPFPLKTRDGVSLSIAGGIPVPGKGENSYDLDDDGIFGTGGQSVDDAVGNAVKAATRSRRKYAGAGWVPDAGWRVGRAAA